MTTDNLFMGKNGFHWWVGIVEDNGDPKGLGRCRVRIVGHHNADREELPTEALPWAYPLTPITNSAIGGIGTSAIGPQINTRVFGFFADGAVGLQPIMMMTIPGKSIKETFEDVPYGATPQQPFTEKLFGFSPFGYERDCPDGYDLDNTHVNTKIPDPRKIEINSSEWSIPMTGFVSSAYAERSGRHNGVDICPAGFYRQLSAGAKHLNGKLRGPTGIPVYSAADGVVKYIWTKDKGQSGQSTTYDTNGRGSRSFGNAIAIEHTLSTGTFVTIYAHLGENQDPRLDTTNSGINVAIGQSVSKGQQIGTLGRTHVRDSLTHIHFEIRFGSELPKAFNHINPGRVFPQLKHRHHAYRSWADSQSNYNVALPFNAEKAPVIAKEAPR
jgi:hypothetical protein